MPASLTPGQNQTVLQSQIGAQAPILVASAPAAAAIVPGTLLNGLTLTVAGLYRCLIPIAGLRTRVQVHLIATWTGGTVSSDLDTLYLTTNPADPSTWTKKTAGSNDGSVTTATRQTALLETLNGERFAVYDLTLTGTTSVAISQAEYNGI